MLELVFGAQEEDSIKRELYGYRKDAQNTLRSQSESQPAVSADRVIALSLAQYLGDISGSPICEARAKLLSQIFCSNSTENQFELEEQVKSHWEQNVLNYEALKKQAEHGFPIRIWYSLAPYSMCGFYSSVYELREFDCQITAVKLPEYSCNGGTRLLTSWGEISPADIHSYLSFETVLSDGNRLAIATRWNQLKKENSWQRACINGHLFSVDNNFYDYYICEKIGNNACKVSHLIVDVLSGYNFGIADWPLANRIQHLLDVGEFEILCKFPRFYDCIIKKCTA